MKSPAWVCPQFLRTFSGRAFPLSPGPEDVCLKDVAHGLSIAPRWGSQSKYRYPVAAHAIYVSLLVPPEYRFEALNHDDSEAYLCDLPKPFKEVMPQYKAVEHNIMTAIGTKFGFRWPNSPIVKHADMVALYQERKAFFDFPIGKDVPYARLPRGLKLPKWDFQFWSDATSKVVEHYFIEYFERYE